MKKQATKPKPTTKQLEATAKELEKLTKAVSVFCEKNRCPLFLIASMDMGKNDMGVVSLHGDPMKISRDILRALEEHPLLKTLIELQIMMAKKK